MGTERADAFCLALVRSNHNLAVPHFLIHSYLYYVEDSPLISDAAFEEIVGVLEANWSKIRHRHKRRLDRKLLKSGFYLKYPSMVPGAAIALRSHLS